MAAPKIGVFLPTMWENGGATVDVAAAARHVEALGFDSAWAVDQLVAGTGVPFVDATVALSTAAAVTERIDLAYGVLILPLRPVAWAAKQAASLQHVSGDRLILGVGIGGDRHERSWTAAGVPRKERGRRTDAGLEVLADLLAGKEADIDGAPVQLAPGATVPPIVVGGLADAALRRAATYGDGWFAVPVDPELTAQAMGRLGELAAEQGRPTPTLIASSMAVIDGDPAVPSAEELVAKVSDVDGLYGMPAEAVPDMVVTGPPAAIAERIAALGEVGAETIAFTLAAGDWFRQAELLAEAVALVR